MGLYTKGLLSTSVFKLRTRMSLEDIAKTIASNRYPARPEKASRGWGSVRDDEYFTHKESVQAMYSGVTPRPEVNQNETVVLGGRFYYDVVNTTLAKRFGDSEDWKRYHERRAFDVLFINEGEPEMMTALVSSRRDDEINSVACPAMNSLLQDDSPPGQVGEPSITEELDPDFFLWLLYKLDQGGDIGEGVSISEIMAINSKNFLGRTRFNDGAGPDRPDLMILVAGGSGKFGPAKVSLTHAEEPEGEFEVEIHHDARYVVMRDSSYEDDELASIPKELVGQRMVEDMWQIILPKLRSAYQRDESWKSTEREVFKGKCKEDLIAILFPDGM